MKENVSSSASAARTQPDGSGEKLLLADAPNFISMPPTVSVTEALVLNEQAQQWFPQSQPSAEERWQRKGTVEFIL